jgi:hypothetical protein
LAVLGLVLASADAATMLLRYDFDEASSGTTNALDVSGYGTAAPGMFIGSATRTSNTPGGASLGALDLMTGDVNDDYVSGGDADKLDQLSAMTLTAWVNLRTASSGTSVSGKRLLSKWGPSSSDNGWQWVLDSDITGWGAITTGATTADFRVGDLAVTSSTKLYASWLDGRCPCLQRCSEPN